ncbi:unnamed protein product [Schistosoma margrebowiei]|uniref:Dol-P-Glc:Glc(2)Man(9)GlcNAc(2)-PP-Dol alpha-1,2-glucosyltransferase n=1 Tax=Schistosoma margrebowiei TaxID=48269 RepID=A0AA85AMV4_9TREM|nr:unnamed protein product [Schistosoma margrebowiei]
MSYNYIVSWMLITFTAAISCVLTYVFSRYQHDPYMDEVFHVRQTLKYIQGNWKFWDRKITTPPGLYVAYVSAHRVLSSLGVLPPEPTAMHFRFSSVLFSIINHIIILRLVKIMKCNSPNILAINIASEPLFLFFSAFYYTDHCSILFVMASVYFSLLHHDWLSALFVSYAVFTRQSNIIWVPLLMCIHTSGSLSQNMFGHDRCSSTMWIKRLLYMFITHPLSVILVILKSVLRPCLPFVLVLVSFISFVIINKGIVLGDREAHTAVLNIPQFFYFATFCALSTPIQFVGFIINSIKSFKNLLVHRSWRVLSIFLLLTLLFVLIIITSLKYCLFIHPYLISDNRHYTFYIWRKIIYRNVSTYYSLSVVYLVATAYFVNTLFFSYRNIPFGPFIERLVLLVCTFIVVIASGLLELRYFLIPFALWRIFAFSHTHYKYLLCEVLWNLLIVFITAYLFIFKPFEWPSEPGVYQRFMW